MTSLRAAFNSVTLSRLIEEGGDWDRRNRLKVYQGLHLLSIRSFQRGGELFNDALSTFTANELIDYNEFVTLCVIVNTLCLKRVDLKKKVRHYNMLIILLMYGLDSRSAGSDAGLTRGHRLSGLHKISLRMPL